MDEALCSSIYKAYKCIYGSSISSTFCTLHTLHTIRAEEIQEQTQKIKKYPDIFTKNNKSGGTEADQCVQFRQTNTERRVRTIVYRQHLDRAQWFARCLRGRISVLYLWSVYWKFYWPEVKVLFLVAFFQVGSR